MTLKQHVISQVLGSGLFNSSDEHRFSHYGCEFCGCHHCSVYDVKGYVDLDRAAAKELEDFQLCAECITNLS